MGMKLVAIRSKILTEMNEYLKERSDDYTWGLWIAVFPDEADDDDIDEIATDEELWMTTVARFAACCRMLGILE